MFRVAVCDDQILFAESIVKMCEIILEKRFGDTKDFSVELFTNGNDLISKHGKKKKFDLIVSEIQMKEMDGITMASIIRTKDKNVPIVFLTTTDEFIMKGYEVHAYRYLIKASEEYGNWNQIESLIDRILNERKRSNKMLLLKDGGSYKRILVNDILYLEINGRGTKIHTKREKLLSKEKMSEISKHLDENIFMKCHQSYIVNLKYACEIKRYNFVLVNNGTIPISRAYWEDVKTAFLQSTLNR